MFLFLRSAKEKASRLVLKLCVLVLTSEAVLLFIGRTLVQLGIDNLSEGEYAVALTVLLEMEVFLQGVLAGALSLMLWRFIKKKRIVKSNRTAQ